MFNVKLINRLLDTLFKRCSHDELAQKSIAFAVITSLFLVLIKFAAWLITNSISMQASMMDSILDALASFLAYHAAVFATSNYDENHNFGHEKVEGVVAFLQCLLVIYSGIVICREAYEMYVDPKPVANSTVGIVVMLVSCVAVYFLVYFQVYATKKTESILVKGDSLHYLSDLLMNTGIIASLVLSQFFIYVDAICGVAVGAYVLYSAIIIIRNALTDLMDEALPKKVRQRIQDIILSVTGVREIILLRTRSAGMKKYIEARIRVDDNLSLKDANKIVQDVENSLAVINKKIDVFIKAEP